MQFVIPTEKNKPCPRSPRRGHSGYISDFCKGRLRDPTPHRTTVEKDFHSLDRARTNTCFVMKRQSWWGGIHDSRARLSRRYRTGFPHLQTSPVACTDDKREPKHASRSKGTNYSAYSRAVQMTVEAPSYDYDARTRALAL